MAGHVAHLRVARIGDDLRHTHAGRIRIHFGFEQRRKLPHRGIRGKYGILAAVRSAFRGPCGVRIGKIFHEQFGAGPLGGHSRGAYGESGKKAHEFFPSSMALWMVCNWDRARLAATWNRIAFSASSLDSRSRLTLFPSAFTGSPSGSTV